MLIVLFCWFISRTSHSSFFFFFNDTATTEIYTLSLHDALPICVDGLPGRQFPRGVERERDGHHVHDLAIGDELRAHVELKEDRKSTRLNSSHSQISYAVFCLKKKKPHYIY